MGNGNYLAKSISADMVNFKWFKIITWLIRMVNYK